MSHPFQVVMIAYTKEKGPDEYFMRETQVEIYEPKPTPGQPNSAVRMTAIVCDDKTIHVPMEALYRALAAIYGTV